MSEELMDFVKWLPEHVELFKGLTTEETVSKINNLSTSEEGKETLEQLTKQYRNTEMGIFKEGGKLHQLLCFKTGGKGMDCGRNKVTKHQETSVLPKYKGNATWGFYQGAEHDLGDKGKIYEHGYTQQTPGDTVGGDMSGYRFNWGDNQSVYVSDNDNGRHIRYNGQDYGRKDFGTNPKLISELPVDIQRQIEYADSVLKKNAPLITKHQETSILPKYAKIVEQGWGKPRYTFMSNHNPSDPKSPLNTVTPDNIWNGGYQGVWMAREDVENPQDSVKFGAVRQYGEPQFDIMVDQYSEAGPVYVAEIAPFYSDEEYMNAVKELAQKHNKIRNKK